MSDSQLRRSDRRSGGSALIAAVVTDAAKNHPIKFSLNIFGLLLLFCAAGIAPSKEQQLAYENDAPEPGALDALSRTRTQAFMAKNMYEQSKGWFWSCDSKCSSLKADYEKKLAVMQAAESRVEEQQRAANAHLGVFGRQAVSEVKQLFWNGVEGAKGFAKRSTWWDMLFVGIRSIGRDQGLAEYVVEIVLRFLMNLFIGLFANTVTFVFYVWGVIKMYNADPVSSACFWLLCILAAVSFLVTCTFAMWSTVVMAASGIGSVVGGPRRIRDTRE